MSRRHRPDARATQRPFEERLRVLRREADARVSRFRAHLAGQHCGSPSCEKCRGAGR